MKRVLLALISSSSILLTSCQSMQIGTETSPTIGNKCAVTSPFETTDFNAEFEANINALMAHMIDTGIAPGAVVKIQQGGQTVFERAYGFADSADNRPMEIGSLFRIYSMTKPITSIAALQLVDAGEIDLDDPIKRYLPEFEEIEVAIDESGNIRRRPARAPTIRDLLRHTSGLTYRTGAKADPIAALYASYGVPAGPGVSDAPTNGMPPVSGDETFIDRIAQMPLKHDPGTAFTYGNSTDVLGAIVAKVSGKPLSKYLKENIFIPVGMTDTFFSVPQERSVDFTSAYIVPPQAPSGSPIDFTVPIDALKPQIPVRLDSYEGGIYSEIPDFEFGGAGLVSDADDYLAFTQALMDGSPNLVSSELWEEATRNQLSIHAKESATFLSQRGFGLGFAIREVETEIEPVFPQCGLFWAGAASTYFWIDEETNTTGVFLTQVFEGDARSYFVEIIERIYASRPETAQ